jgi:hypothetical protein
MADERDHGQTSIRGELDEDWEDDGAHHPFGSGYYDCSEHGDSGSCGHDSGAHGHDPVGYGLHRVEIHETRHAGQESKLTAK